MKLVPLASLPQGVPGARKEKVYPASPVPYSAVLRGERRAWWKPLVALLLFSVMFFGLAIAIGLAVGIVMAANGVTEFDPEDAIAFMTNTADPVSLTAILGAVIIMLPFAYLSMRIVFGERPGMLHSVKGKIRWGLLGWLSIAIVPIWLIYIFGIYGLAALTGQPLEVNPNSNFPVLLVIIILLVPIQAFTEELIYRGAIFQAVGSWFRTPKTGAIVAGLVASIVFAASHGSTDIWIVSEIFIMGIVGAFVTYKTGGLEATTVLHVVNNVVIFILDGLSGGSSNSLAFAEDADGGGPFMLIIALIAYGIVAFAIVRMFKSYEKKQALSRQVGETPEFLTEPKLVELIEKSVAPQPAVAQAMVEEVAVSSPQSQEPVVTTETTRLTSSTIETLSEQAGIGTHNDSAQDANHPESTVKENQEHK